MLGVSSVWISPLCQSYPAVPGVQAEIAPKKKAIMSETNARNKIDFAFFAIISPSFVVRQIAALSLP